MPSRRSASVIGSHRPRLSRQEAWGDWRISADRKTLVCIAGRAGNYQVTLAELLTADACVARMQQVIAEKASWVDQRVLDDLLRALKKVTGFALPPIVVDHR